MAKTVEVVMVCESEWSKLLDEFRQLGGKANNVRLGVGPLGRGLFSMDPSQPVELFCPENLLFHCDDLIFEDGRLKVAPQTSYGAGDSEKAWFERYSETFGWGDARHSIEQSIKGMQALPEAVCVELATTWGLTACLSDFSDSLVQSHFFNSRSIGYSRKLGNEIQRNRVLMPVVDLVNHGNQASFYFDQGIGVAGIFEGEILASYGRNKDSWGLFRNWGFATEAPFALSRVLTLKTSFGELRIARELNQCSIIKVPGLGEVVIPELVVEEKRAKLSFATLASRDTPRVPKGVFKYVFQQVGLPNAEEIFDLVRHLNSTAFLGLLDLLEGVPGEQASTMRSAVRLQLKALSHCYGIREIPFGEELAERGQN